MRKDQLARLVHVVIDVGTWTPIQVMRETNAPSIIAEPIAATCVVANIGARFIASMVGLGDPVFKGHS